MSEILSDYGNILLTSMVCVHEIVHLIQIGKVGVRKGDDVRSVAKAVIDAIVSHGVGIMPVTMKHVETLAALPLFDDHRDPNDRLIISQAVRDRIPLISSDRKFYKYERYGLEFVFNER